MHESFEIFQRSPPLEADDGAERAARQRDLERQLEYQIERQRRADRGEGREQKRSPPVPGQRSEYIEGRGRIDPNQRNNSNIDRGRDEQFSQSPEFARPEDAAIPARD